MYITPLAMSSLTADYLASLSFDARRLASIQRLGEARGRQDLFIRQAPGQLESLRQVAMVESSESSNRIEGVVAAQGRVAELVVHGASPRNRSEQEIAGYRDALQLIHESHAEMRFTTNVLLQLHGMLFRYLPDGGGRWKSTDNEIVERNQDGAVVRVRFTPTTAAATPHAMDLLVSNYDRAREQREADPLVLVPLAVLDMLCVHPFRDGNGRIARLLTLLLLYKENYRVGRYVSLERIIEQSKQTYYETLEQSSQRWHDDRHDAHPWVTYFWGVLIRAYGEFEDRVETLKGSKTRQIRDAVLRRLTPFSISDLESDCPGISRDMIRHVMRQMKAEGTIAPTGKGRSAKWRRVVE
jgi:Fic family protein